MIAMTTGTVCGKRGAVLRSEPMVALKKRLHAVRGKVVLGVQPFGSVAFAAKFGGNFQGRATLETNDLVLRMAIGAGRRVAMAGGDGLHRLPFGAQDRW